MPSNEIAKKCNFLESKHSRLLNAGADKISINSSAIRRPGLIDEIAKNFGSQVCVLAVDAKQTAKGWRCYLNGGRVETDKELFAWTKEAQERGAGDVYKRQVSSSAIASCGCAMDKSCICATV